MKIRCGILFVLLLAVLSPVQLSSQSVTDELTEQILKLQLLQTNYQELEKKSIRQETQLEKLEESNQQLQTDLATITQNYSQLSRDYTEYETKLKLWKIYFAVITPIATVTTAYVIADLMNKFKGK